MPARGLTPRTLFRIQARYFQHEVKVEKLGGRVNDRVSKIELATVSCMYVGTSRTIFQGEQRGQSYDSAVIVRAQGAFADRNTAYKLTVREFKPHWQKADPNGPPEINREISLEPVQIDDFSDIEGSLIFQVFRCVNAKQD